MTAPEPRATDQGARSPDAGASVEAPAPRRGGGSARVEIRLERFDSSNAASLLAGADSYNELLYGHADESPIDPDEFAPARGGAFFVAYLDGKPVACGGFRRAEPPAPEGTAEVKRMFVAEVARGRGLGRLVLNTLEDAARHQGYPEMVLDVGRKQHAAHALYEGNGYRRIPGFTIYRDKPGNRAYAKRLV